MCAVEVLMQAVVIAGSILEHQRCWLVLAGMMTPVKELHMRRWIAHFNAHGRIPTVGNRDQMRVHSIPELSDEIRKRIPEVLIFSTAKAMAAHHDAAAEQLYRGSTTWPMLHILSK